MTPTFLIRDAKVFVIQTSDFVGKSGSDDDCGKSGYSCRKNINKRGESEADKISVLHTPQAFHQDAVKVKAANYYTAITIQVLPGDLIKAI